MSDRQEFKVVVLGDGGVGKSSLTIRFITNMFVEEYEDPTIEDSYRKMVMLDEEPMLYDVLDTAGQDEFMALHDAWIREGEGFVIVYDVTNRHSFDYARQEVERILRAKDCDEDDLPILFVGNKTDRQDQREVEEEEGRELAARSPSWDHIETSARDGVNIDEAFLQIGRRYRSLKDPYNGLSLTIQNRLTRGVKRYGLPAPLPPPSPELPVVAEGIAQLAFDMTSLFDGAEHSLGDVVVCTSNGDRIVAHSFVLQCEPFFDSQLKAKRHSSRSSSYNRSSSGYFSSITAAYDEKVYLHMPLGVTHDMTMRMVKCLYDGTASVTPEEALVFENPDGTPTPLASQSPLFFDMWKRFLKRRARPLGSVYAKEDHRLVKLYKSAQRHLLGDVQLIAVDDTNGEHKTPIRCHRALLAHRLSYFRPMFVGEFAEKNRVSVNVPMISFRALQALIQHLYSGHNAILFSHAHEILMLSDFFGLPRSIVDVCESWCCHQIRDDTVCVLLQSCSYLKVNTSIQVVELIKHCVHFASFDSTIAWSQERKGKQACKNDEANGEVPSAVMEQYRLYIAAIIKVRESYDRIVQHHIEKISAFGLKPLRRPLRWYHVQTEGRENIWSHYESDITV